MIEKQLQQLLQLVGEAYDASDVKKNYPEWSYSLCATRIEPRAPMILGFNWGAAKGHTYTPQDSIPPETFMDLYHNGNLGSLRKIVRYLETYFPEDEVGRIGQSNFCFFRSKIENQISSDDLKRCLPLFEQFLRIAEPSEILIFSAALRNHLKTKFPGCFSEKHTLVYPAGNRSYTVEKGHLQREAQSIPIYSLPHPNAHIPGSVRDAAWEFCFA